MRITPVLTTLYAGVAISSITLSAAEASALSLTTLFSANNGGDPGGAVYFNLETKLNDLLITSLETNTEAIGGSTSGFQVFTKLGTADGSEADISAWSLATAGSITRSGEDNPSSVLLDNPIQLQANTLYGFALVMPGNVGHDYTNGSSCSAYTAAGNCFYSNADLSILAGTASNQPFSSALFSPRVWNGTINYQTSPSTAIPTPALLPGLLGLGTAVWRKRRQSEVV